MRYYFISFTANAKTECCFWERAYKGLHIPLIEANGRSCQGETKYPERGNSQC